MKTLTEKYKSILIETFEAFINFCNEHNLKYIAAYGTVIGAVRHKGLIPWDDDIDVYMQREDYERFISLKKHLKNSNYEIVSIENDKGYYLPYAKFCCKTTSLWEVKRHPFMIGVFIDIFPLDRVSSNLDITKRVKLKYDKYFANYINCIIDYTLKESINFLMNFHLKTAFHGIMQKLFYKYFAEYYRTKFINLDKRINNNVGEKFLCYSTTYDLRKEIYEIDWILDTIEVPFETLVINIPRNYHDYLSSIYGNYMELPPIEKRFSTHEHYFVNLNKRIDIQNV